MFAFAKPKMWMVVGLGVVVASSVGAGTVLSYVRTAHSQIGETIRDTVPITFELKRLKQMTSDLVPEIQTNQKVAASLDVEVDYLQREIEQMRKGQTEAEGQMQKLREALASQLEKYEFGGQSFTRQKIEDDLGQRLKRYGNTRIQLEAKERILGSRKQTLAAATEKIRQYQHQHQLLVETAESLQSELELVEMAQHSGIFSFDKSKLNQAKKLSMEVEKKIRTLQKLVNGQQQVQGEIPVEADSRPITEVYDDYFTKK
jgi:chromosome segregation ATPase